MKTKMKLAFDLSWTHLQGRWRLPGSWTGRTYPDMTVFKEVASIAERGRIDMLFFGDGTGIPSTWRGSIEEAVRWGIGWPRQDMSPYISVLAQDYEHRHSSPTRDDSVRRNSLYIPRLAPLH
jgi:long-chain alkane monooxygenase